MLGRYSVSKLVVIQTPAQHIQFETTSREALPAVFSISLTKRNRPANQNRKPMKSSHQEQIDQAEELVVVNV